METIHYSLIAENYVLGTVLYKPSWWEHIADLEVQDFATPDAQTIFKLLQSFHQQNKVFGYDIIYEYCEINKIAISPSRWIDLSTHFCSDEKLHGYVADLKKDAKKRKLEYSLVMGLEKIRNTKTDNPDYDAIFSDVEKIVNQQLTTSMRDAKNMTQAVAEFVHRATQKQGYEPILTGFPSIDALTGGLKRGHLIIMAGMPSHGKTALGLNMALNAALSGKKVGILSLEMPIYEVTGRLLSTLSRIPYTTLENQLNTVLAQAYQHINHLQGMDTLFIEDFFDIPCTITQIKSVARKLKKTHNIDMLLVDYLGRINPSRARENKNVEVAEISNALKSLALELNVPILTICQVNRKNTEGLSKKPKAHHLRDSGSIEYDADEIFMVYYPYKLDMDNEEPNKIEFIIEKQRNGKLGTVTFNYVGECFAFEEQPEHEMRPLPHYLDR